MDITAIREIAQELCRIEHNRPVLVGVSGGPDSLSLLDLLRRLGFMVIAAHYDHQLRPESGWEAAQVQAAAAILQIPFVTGSSDVGMLARTEHLSIEEAARQARYRWLFAQAEAQSAQAIAVAHNADDQVETVLMHLLRGTGLGGLKGMPFYALPNEWSGRIPLVRPLLGTWREEIETYCKERRIAPLRDPSNQDIHFFRNRLRLELVPFLQGYNPKIKPALWRMANTLGADQEALLSLFEPVWQNCLIDQQADSVRLSLSGTRALSPGLQRRVLRKAISVLLPNLRDLDFSVVERGLKFIAQPTSTNQIDLASGLRMFIEADTLFLAGWEKSVRDADWPFLLPDQSAQLLIPGQVQINQGWQFTASLLDSESMHAEIPLEHPYQAILDADLIQPSLTIRTRQPGDRFRPLGMDGHSLKVSDFYINEHLPVRARNGWPLVCSGEEIAWIPGFRPSHLHRVTAQTTRQVLLSLTRS